jgi:hypothetical protein
LSTSSEPWFSVRCVFQREGAFEERITLWLADDFDTAIAHAEAEAREYAEIAGMEYLGLAQAFHLFESELQPGTEVFSLIRKSDLDADDYLSAFFATGTEFERPGEEDT